MRQQEREKVKKYIQSHTDRKIQSVNFPFCDFPCSRKNQSECLSRMKRQHRASYKCERGCFHWSRNFIHFPSDFQSLPKFDSSPATIEQLPSVCGPSDAATEPFYKKSCWGNIQSHEESAQMLAHILFLIASILIEEKILTKNWNICSYYNECHYPQVLYVVAGVLLFGFGGAF